MHELANGRLVATERDGHPDSIAEAFRRRITVLERQQIIGRGRGLWRTADNPLHVLVLTDVPLDMPVEELTTDAAERPSWIGRLRSAPSPSSARHTRRRPLQKCGRMPTGHSMRADSTAEAARRNQTRGGTLDDYAFPSRTDHLMLRIPAPPRTGKQVTASRGSQ